MSWRRIPAQLGDLDMTGDVNARCKLCGAVPIWFLGRIARALVQRVQVGDRVGVLVRAKPMVAAAALLRSGKSVQFRSAFVQASSSDALASAGARMRASRWFCTDPEGRDPAGRLATPV